MNLDIVDDDIEDVLILSADHLYTMDYDDIYEEHKKRGNDLTVAVFNVSPNDVSRFGIFTLDDYGNLISFEEKPEQSDSTLASMGIYIFKRYSFKLCESVRPQITDCKKCKLIRA